MWHKVKRRKLMLCGKCFGFRKKKTIVKCGLTCLFILRRWQVLYIEWTCCFGSKFEGESVGLFVRLSHFVTRLFHTEEHGYFKNSARTRQEFGTGTNVACFFYLLSSEKTKIKWRKNGKSCRHELAAGTEAFPPEEPKTPRPRNIFTFCIMLKIALFSRG